MYYHLKVRKPSPCNNLKILIECAFLRNSIDSCDALSFWNAAGNSNLEAKAFRNADTIEVKQSTLSNIIWKRVEALLKDVEIVIEKNDYDNELWERELPGSWFPHSVNENFLFAKYPSGGHFAPHTDGRAIHSMQLFTTLKIYDLFIDFNTRSFLSVIIFLNDIPVSYGGGTRFYSRDALQNLAQDSSGRWICGQESCVVGEVAAVSGRMLIFNQNLVHEGVCCKDPHFKYIIRSDIMFERSPAVCNSEADIRAYGIFQRAEALAETGHVAEAVPLFRQAFKTSPALAEMMGQ